MLQFEQNFHRIWLYWKVSFTNYTDYFHDFAEIQYFEIKLIIFLFLRNFRSKIELIAKGFLKCNFAFYLLHMNCFSICKLQFVDKFKNGFYVSLYLVSAERRVLLLFSVQLLTGCHMTRSFLFFNWIFQIDYWLHNFHYVYANVSAWQTPVQWRNGK